MSIPNSKQGIQINVNTINTDDLDHLHDSFLHQVHEDDDDDEELIRVVLGRKPLGLSAAAACSNDGVIGKTFSMRGDIEDEKQSSSSSAGIEKALRKVFSMRASSASANEVYRRLDHQYESVPVADEENTNDEVHTQKESDKKGNNILEACRRFFGF